MSYDKQRTFLMQAMIGAHINDDYMYHDKKIKYSRFNSGKKTKLSLLGVLGFTFFIYPYVFSSLQLFLSQFIYLIH